MKNLYKKLIFLGVLSLTTLTFGQNVNTEKSIEPLILSKDYGKAINSTKESVKNKDKENLKLGLQSQFFEVKTECVKALADLEGEEILEKLIEMLRSNQSPQRSTERNIQRREFNFVLISAIEKITGLKLLIAEKLDVKELNRILKESRKWLAPRKGIKFDENQPDEITTPDELLDFPI